MSVLARLAIARTRRASDSASRAAPGPSLTTSLANGFRPAATRARPPSSDSGMSNETSLCEWAVLAQDKSGWAAARCVEVAHSRITRPSSTSLQRRTPVSTSS
eukprot:scaffold15682_cov131-Isochrysis_galbana.AAC.7